MMCVCFAFQLFIGAMGPPGGGRNDITSRFVRHLQVVSIDEFDENTMMRIFTIIADWHFAKGFDSPFSRMGKVNSMFVDFVQRVAL
jgi:dynein heavy chain, axonemal